ncbi:GDP-mannose 4,6-dehydratase [Fibrisoma montanum]|uniref:GDP-mannose 4,6-dehydratase n=1 Tax=Fibrisoma montanum TaxID=2305895 RepID=A0A418M8F6_9BACT|nr:GDP-mannose 4,6-dehydratase [Fibrisoma montanum]RIV22375.1 GDP-mannose 4,6-dehydratase [Fibrisoma montanum]
MKKALICGVSGQDGAYLAKLLLNKGYHVYGGSRDAQMSGFRNLDKLGIRKDVQVVSVNINDFRSVLQTLIKIKPYEVYNLAGQSSVGLSFEQPVETLESISVGTLNLLEAIRFSDLPIKLYNAGSSECFGDTGKDAADELTPFRPRSPYGVAKAAAFWQVANYREAYQLYASTGILFNHESPLRPERFVTRKIVAAACRIAQGSQEKLTLGNIDIARDWGWAPDYVEAMWQMLQQSQPDDYVIATGHTCKLKDFIQVVFDCVGLNWEEHVKTDSSFFRPTDIAEGYANPARARQKLGWTAQHKMEDVARLMVEYQLAETPQFAP